MGARQNVPRRRSRCVAEEEEDAGAMLDSTLRPLIDPPLGWSARKAIALGITADQVTLAGFALGLGAAAAIALGAPGTGLVLIAVNRVADGLDGAIARQTQPTDRGAFLDIVLDFVFYAAIPLAFAVADPIANGWPAALLIAAFLANGAAFLAFATLAAKRGLATSAQGEKSFFFLAGLAEGSETIIVFVACCLWPGAFALLAIAFAAICAVSAAARIVAGYRMLR